MLVPCLMLLAGTDPEVLLLLEVKETDGKARFEYALGQYSDRSLFIQRNEKDIWSLRRSETNTFLHDPQHLIRVYPDKIVGPDGRLLTRVRATDEKWWGEFIPVEPKK